MQQANPLAGIALHAVGALSAASCYTPQKKTKLWAWEVYWISQATVAWLILPILGALLTVPDYFSVLATCSAEVMWKSFGLGFIYGTGGLAFGLAIQYIGFSLTYSLAIGISAILGTLVPLFWTPNDGFQYKLNILFDNFAGQLVLAGIALAVIGIFVCGYAGMLRDSRQQEPALQEMNSRVGLPLAIVAGILSAVFNFALLAGDPLAKAAAAAGANEVLSMNAIYPFSHGGCWLINLFWCVFLIRKNNSAGQFLRLPQGQQGLGIYYLMAFLSGAFWYFQFFFYGMGHLNLAEKFGFTSWAIHMSLLILFSNLYGYLFKEWAGSSPLPKRVLHLGMLMIVVATLIITWGTRLGETSP